MSRHFEQAEGLCENVDAATEGFRYNHTMLRIKDPKVSLDFYTRVLGMRLVRRLDFDEMNFTLYFLGLMGDDEAAQVPADESERTTWTFSRPAMLELTHNWGSENDPAVQYHNGNDQPQGFGHLAINVPDIYAACERFEQLGVEFVKRPDDGKMKGIAFIKDPDGYWIEVVQPDLMARIARGE